MDMLRQWNRAMDYIEENLCGTVDPEQAARLACVTRASFERFFSYMTGMSLHAYVRRRRLTQAALELQQGELRVIDAAVKYGFESADAFARAFAKQHGISPGVVKKHPVSLKICPPASFHIVVKGAKEMDFRWVQLEETPVCGVSKVFDREKYLTREALRHSMWSEECDNVPGRLCGGAWNTPGSVAYDGVWYGLWRDGAYTIARQKEDVKTAPEETTLAPGLYAAFSTPPGGLAWEELPKLFEEIFEAWLPASGYALRGGDIVEVYHLWTDHDERKKKRWYEVWVQVEQK